MSNHVPSAIAPDDPSTLEIGLEAFQSSAEFHGPVEDLDDSHHCNDHFAQIYESNAERFAAAIPFVRHGLDRDERVMYLIDESTETDVKAVLREGGIDIDTALEAGALSFHTVQETYLQNGSFDVDEMIDFYANIVDEATEEYTGLRIVAETTWLQNDTASVEQFMEYEAKINELFEETESMALCQYDRDGFPPEVIRDIVQSHPHLIYDGVVCHNVYYTPPKEFFAENSPAREVNRMLGTLRDRAAVKNKLHHRDRFLRELYTITADATRSFDEKVQALFEVGCDLFNMELGAIARVDPETDQFEIERTSYDHEYFEPGLELQLSETYCTAATDAGGPAGVTDPEQEGYDDITVRREFGIESYLGTHICGPGGNERTFFFVTSDPRDDPITEIERTVLDLMGQWIEYELERKQREQFLRECYEITADPALEFDEKLHELLDLAREQMGLDAAGLTYLPERDEKFLNEYTIGYVDEGLWTDPGDDHYCRQVINSDEPVGKADVRGTEWEDDQIYQKHGLTCYLGTKVTSDSTLYGSLWVGCTEPRDHEFTETERTFLKLIGQWVSYEIERRHHHEAQRELYEITANPEFNTDEKLTRLLEVGCDRLDLPAGMLTREHGQSVEIKHMYGSHPNLNEGMRSPPLTDNYCRQVIDTGTSVSVADAEAAGWDGTILYNEFDLECYTGTPVTVDGITSGTVFFTDTSPREEFTDSEQAFLDLLGQCVSYELERQQYEQELEEVIDQLQQSNERLEHFAYAASHDLQEPLRMVTSYLQLLETRYGDSFDEDGEEFLEYAVDGAERMREMIDGLLEYSRIETQGEPFEPVELDTVLGDVLADLQIRIEETEAEIEADRLPRVEGDASQLRQMFQNLLDNALTYSGDEPPEIRINAERRGQEWVISVHDNGIGIDPDNQDQIFTVFDRLHSREEYDGTGLGLALCQRIVERHDGEIWVESEPDKGSTFSFTLPAA